MAFSDEIIKLDPKAIKVPANRQRSDMNEETLAELCASIKTMGQAHPIIVQNIKGELILVAGGRRRAACEALGILVDSRLYIPPINFDDEILELDENDKREDLSWRDKVKAIGRLNDQLVAEDKEAGTNWTLTKSSERLSIPIGPLSKILNVYASLNSPKLLAATSLNQAIGILVRFAERRAASIVSEIVGTSNNFLDPDKPKESQPSVLDPPVINLNLKVKSSKPPELESSPSPTSEGPKPSEEFEPETGAESATETETEPVEIQPEPKTPRPTFTDAILCADFFTWIKTYSGQPFNFVHCDFPYGVNTQDSLIESYENTPKIYEDLFTCFLANMHKLLSHSSHLVFWLNMRYYDEAKKRLRSAGLHVIDRPLIWHKSDLRGAAPGIRGTQPRHTYEAALLCSRGNRPLVKQGPDSWPSPSVSNPIHPTQKPESMLEVFFAMLVDETTTFFDPTVGSGASIRAAEKLGARSVLGLELDENYCAAANAATNRARLLRMAGR